MLRQKIRKRGCSSSSSSNNYRLKRAFLVGKRVVTSSTPVPKWKMTTIEQNDKFLVGETAVSARKLAATLWEIDGVGSVTREYCLDDRKSDVGITKERVLEISRLGSKDLVLSDLFSSSVSERMDLAKMGSHRRRGSAGSQKLLQGDCKSPHNCLVEVDQAQNHARSPCRHVPKNRLKDVYNGLITTKELLKVMSRVLHSEGQNSASCFSLFSALKFELDRACIHVSKLIEEQRSKVNEMDVLLKQLEEEKLVWKLKEQERIRNAITSIAGELQTERKLRKQTERLNKKLGRELAETKVSLSKTSKEVESEKRAREILEQVCDELARGIGEDRAEVEELKRRSEKVCEEVEKEREMLQLADVIREERVQMKLAEAKYQFEEKTAVVDKLRNELEAYLKSKKGEEQVDGWDGSPSYDKIKELEKYLRETLPVSYQYADINEVNKDEEEEEEEEEEDDDDSGDSELHSIELNMDDISKSFQWSDVVKNESKRNSFDKTKGRKSKKPDGCTTSKPDTLDVFDRRGVFEFASQPWKKDVEDEIERYNMIKDLRDHIVSSSRIASSQELASPSQKFGKLSVSSKDPPNGVACQG